MLVRMSRDYVVLTMTVMHGSNAYIAYTAYLSIHYAYTTIH